MKTFRQFKEAVDGDDIKAFIEFAKNLGIDIGIHKRAVEQDWVVTRFTSQNPGQGKGSQVMARLCQLADTHRVKVRLWAASTKPEFQLRLVKFYKRFGFHHVRKATTPFNQRQDLLIRNPQ